MQVKLELSFFVNFWTFWIGFHMDCPRNVSGLWKKVVSFNCTLWSNKSFKQYIAFLYDCTNVHGCPVFLLFLILKKCSKNPIMLFYWKIFINHETRHTSACYECLFINKTWLLFFNWKPYKIVVIRYCPARKFADVCILLVRKEYVGGGGEKFIINRRQLIFSLLDIVENSLNVAFSFIKF